MYFDGINPVKMLTKDFDMFWKFYPAAMARMSFWRLTKKKLRSPIYGGKIVVSQSKSNELLKQGLCGEEPFMFGRNGSNEVLMSMRALMCEKKITDTIDAGYLSACCDHSGFFPNEKNSLLRFKDLIIDSTRQSDIYGCFRPIGEDYFVKHFTKDNAVIAHTNMLDFWRYDEPYTSALKGQKVLVVHYLANQIEDQYKKRELLFDNPSVLPEFELMTMPAVQTIAGNRDPRFKDWFEALDFMYEETKKYDYDVALLGCGAYGMPLAAKLKKDGKKVVYMGGVLQMLFGIWGKRWEVEPGAMELRNEHWVSPDPNFIPKGSESVEDGCYW